MVIHDMRTPTNSIEFAIKESLKILEEESRQSMRRAIIAAVG